MADYKYNCFAYRSKRADCACLIEKLCDNPDPNYVCPFYKDKATVDPKKMAADIREYALTYGGKKNEEGTKKGNSKK